jgi:hypothetical protein
MQNLQRCALALILFFVGADARGGYTHYFIWHQKPDETSLHECLTEMRRVVDARTSALAGPNGNGRPELEDLRVDFNGAGANGYEPFSFPGEVGFNFCKTEHQPYDDVVTACLLVARDHFPSSVLEITSDGSWETGDWRNGASLYSSVTRRPALNPMVGESSHHAMRNFALILGVAALFIALLLRSARRKRGSP